MAFINKINNKDDDDSYDFEPHLTYSNRKYISFINIRNSTYMGFTTPIKIEKNDNLEIHFIHPPSELNSFFDNSFFDSLFGEEEQLGEEEEFLINYFGDNNISSIDFSYFDSSLVDDMSKMFAFARSIEELNFSNFDTSKVTLMDSMFSGCSGLLYLNLSNFNTSNVKSMDSMFSGCSSLLSLNLSNFDTSNSYSMENMFDSCTSLQYLDISNFKLESSMDVGEIFSNLKSLKYLNLFYIEDSDNILVDEYESLNEISNLIICKKENDIANAINICSEENYFSYPAINYVTITYGSSKYDSNELTLENGYFKIGSNDTLEIHFNYILTELDNIFSCSSSSYFDKENIISYDFSHFDSSQITNMNSMFDGCDSIEYINITNFNSSSATDMGHMFQGCTNLKSLDLTNFDTSLVTDMSNMFSDCNSLEYLFIANFNTENLNTATNMFSNNLQYIDISNMTENEVIKDVFLSLNSNKDLLIYQTKNLAQDANTACCDFTNSNKTDKNNIKCYTNNYIKVQYGKETEYQNGFGSEYRDGIVFIIYNDKLYQKNETLTIEKDGFVEKHFGYNVESLVAFFGYDSSSGSGDEM